MRIFLLISELLNLTWNWAEDSGVFESLLKSERHSQCMILRMTVWRCLRTGVT